MDSRRVDNSSLGGSKMASRLHERSKHVFEQPPGGSGEAPGGHFGNVVELFWGCFIVIAARLATKGTLENH